MPHEGDTEGLLSSAIGKLIPFAERERDAMRAHSDLARKLLDLTDDNGWVCRLPHLGPDASTLDGLVSLAHCMAMGTTILNARDTVGATP